MSEEKQELDSVPKEDKDIFGNPRIVLPTNELWRKLDRSMELISEHGLYISHSVLGLGQPKITNEVSTAGVMANKYGGIEFVWNPGFLSSLTDEEVAFINSHESMHVTSGHVYTRKDNHMLFNICADIIINTWLFKHANFSLSDRLYKSLWHAGKINMDPDRMLEYASADDLYNEFESKADLVKKLLEQYKGMINGDLQEGDGEGEGAPCPMPGGGTGDEKGDGLKGSKGEKSAGATADEHGNWGPIEKSTVDNILGELQRRNQTPQHDPGYGYGSGGLFNGFDKINQNFNWEKALERFIGSVIKRTDSYERPHRRISPSFEDTFIPHSKIKEEYKIAIFVDVSGSISQEQVSRFMAVINRAPKSVTMVGHTFDCYVHEWDMKGPMPGGGGTDFHAVVTHGEELKPKPDAFVVLTDGYCSEPSPRNPKRWMWISTDALLTKRSGSWIQMPDYNA